MLTAFSLLAVQGVKIAVKKIKQKRYEEKKKKIMKKTRITQSLRFGKSVKKKQPH